MIHKEGLKDDPENFRGITLTSNLSKIFNAIINVRISNYLEENNLIVIEQGGFRKDYRTSDHIFVLQTIIQKYINKGNKLYSCFVDLKKAFDSVERQGLIQKLCKIGLGKRTVNLLTNMYKNTHTSIIYKNNILPKIPTTKGLKQGDNLSPLLFNIFINDLPETLKQGKTDPVQLQECNINSMLWADDIILFSETTEGLQQCLDNLSDYCKKWKLEINIKKTKSVIFNKIGKRLKNNGIKLNSVEIEHVSSYTYLGFTISASGKFHLGIQNLVDKAQRAWFSILKILNKSKHKQVDTYLILFDRIIKPILLYACEIWGKTVNNEMLTELGKSLIERFHFKICKQIIGVNKKTSNIATIAELGRYPLYIDIQTQIIKYLLRLKIIKKERLLFKAYQEQIENINEQNNWINNAKIILDKNGLSYIFLNHKDSVNIINHRGIKEMGFYLKNRIKDIFEQNIMYHFHIKTKNKEGKLIFYGQLKGRYIKENYLNIKNVEYRKMLSNIRMSTHKLELETGRYKHIERENRLCKSCNMKKIETEEHFLLECTAYNHHRKMFNT